MKNFGGNALNCDQVQQEALEGRINGAPPLFSNQISELIKEETSRGGNHSGGAFLRTQLEYEGTLKPKSE